jgi:hypothetical protein
MDVEYASADMDFERELQSYLGGVAGQAEDLPLSQRLSIPLMERSAALNYTVRDLEAMVRKRETDQILAVKLPYCKSSWLLNNITRGIIVNLDAVTQDRATGVMNATTPARKYEWGVRRENSEPLYYVPLSYLPN